MTLEDRVSALERRVAELEAQRFPSGWTYYSPLRPVDAPTSTAGGLDAVMLQEGMVPK